MTMNHIIRNHSMPAFPCIVRPRCSGSSCTLARPGGVLNAVHVRPASWFSQQRTLLLASLVALIVSPTTVFAAPPTPRSNFGIDGTHQRRQASTPPANGNNNPNNTSSNGSISMSVWLPILFITVLFMVFSFVVCLRRCAAGDAATATSRTTPSRGAVTPNTGNAARPRRRARRTPSQISTKSLPPYMKEPGDHELVLYRGPAEEAEEAEEHPDGHNTTYDITLHRIESVDTIADSSSTNLIRRVSESVTRPPEAHRRSADAHSMDSTGSEAELLSGHRRVVSVDNQVDPRGEAPAYMEAGPTLATISLNDLESHSILPTSDAVVPPSTATGGERWRFSFLRHNPFGSHHATNSVSSNFNQPSSSISPESLAHIRSGSALSRFSSRESHESHSRPSSGANHLRSHSRSNSNLFHVFRSHSPGLHAGSSTISLDSISAPLTHTVKRAEFYAPKGGLMTPEQIKLITSREALGRFGMPYGPDAVAAFSREKLSELRPPPDFESLAEEHQEQPGTSSGDATEGVGQGSNTPDVGLEAAPRSMSLSPVSQPSLSDRSRGGAASPVSTALSYATAPGSDAEGRESQVQTLQVHTSEDDTGADEPDTAQPTSPGTARPLNLSGDHGVTKHS